MYASDKFISRVRTLEVEIAEGVSEGTIRRNLEEPSEGTLRRSLQKEPSEGTLRRNLQEPSEGTFRREP